ncbi:triacylglycerol esterase/lipase EstA (alpha/beta hydrolase family) [Paraburkholderia silvatlantica]|uniref:Triacylglycerol esterase/lipase EstA (Alpha/beta hydrolase family) n=2 Tax=Paraburkholderia silvatlantica TaxID=321895 RepID=A0A2V4TYM9_9BURK|nr:triacylglycerol esterase/lipase EstA (alpha/beta hydrolase family) [Paraburkholderia silvatlantica]
MVPDRVIPVVFVPGVMGTNLETKDTTMPVWLLNDTWSAMPWMAKKPKERKQLLAPGKTQVHGGGKIPSGTAQTEAELRRRGWGEVARLSYGEWLVWLENALNDAHAATDYGRKGLRESLCHIVTPGLEKLSRDEVALSYKYQFPVHAVGYNWLQSNAVSAERLASRIDEITAWYRQQFNYRCDRVILVTHSMGGLVARYYSEVMGLRDKVLGVVHGVMPATGAAATYKRIKTGTEGVAGLALGPTAAAMTAVVGSAPGPLQLLPSRDYGMGWLQIRDGERFVTLPQPGKGNKVDPYSQIYTVRGTWWGLCDDNLLNPLDPAKKTIDQDWGDFEDLIQDKVQKFHTQISNKYHANTYVFYGDDEKHKAYGNVTWTQQTPPLLRGGVPPMAELLGTRGNDDPATGGQLVKTTLDGKASFARFVLRDVDEHGDGTVPVRSGRAPAHQARACAAFAGVEHEGAYKLDATRRFTLHAITRIAQSVKGTAAGLQGMRKTRATLAVACLILTVAACDHQPAPLSQQEKQIVTELTANLKTRCVGRYLIDMPGEAVESGYAKIQGVSIEAKAMTEDAWRQEVAQREAALKATKSRDAYPFLYEAGKARGENTYYFIHRGTIYNDPSRRYIEGYKWDRGYRFLLKIEAYDYLHPDQTDEPIVQKMTVKNGAPGKSAVVFSLLEKLRGRSQDDIPTEAGVCFTGGFLPAPAGNNEEVNTGFFNPTHMRDVIWSVFTSPDFLEDTTVSRHADSAEARAALKAMNGKDVRKGAVELSGLKATEWLYESLKPGDGRGDTFSIAANETTSRPATPYFSMELSTGGQYKVQGQFEKFDPPSLTTSEAVALWDAVSRTLRLRPGAL